MEDSGGLGEGTTATALKVRTLLPHPRLLYLAVAGFSLSHVAEVKKVFSSVLVYVVHEIMLTFILLYATIVI